ncbi:hypothetical protein BH160DRAFT_7148 [Burkholderia sp. H160]|nr:hypothetical protein BH160DRAFT_7148 [Burkholderia sp. H160]
MPRPRGAALPISQPFSCVRRLDCCARHAGCHMLDVAGKKRTPWCVDGKRRKVACVGASPTAERFVPSAGSNRVKCVAPERDLVSGPTLQLHSTAGGQCLLSCFWVLGWRQGHSNTYKCYSPCTLVTFSGAGLTLRFRGNTGLANVSSRRSLTSSIRRVQMTFDETPRCRRDDNLVCTDCECVFEMLAHRPHEGRCTVKHAIAQSTDGEIKGTVRGFHCRRCMLGCVDKPDNWLASYVRTQLRAMAGDVFSVSRHTADITAHALQDHFLAETDAVLKRILDLAALRCLRDGSSTITQEDVKLALRLVT